MVTASKTGAIRPSKAPNLPIAPVDYDQRYIDQLNNVLRLYFAQIDNALQELTSMSSQLPFYNQVAQGLVPGYSIVNISGENPDVDQVYEDLWYQGGLMTYPAAAVQMTLSSSSAADTNSSGSGAHQVFVSGLDSNYNVITETVSLNGQTGVTTTNSFIRINKLTVASVGTGLFNAGTVYIGVGAIAGGIPATIYNTIPVGANISLSFSYTIPAGYTGYLIYARLTAGQESGSTGVTARLNITDGVTNNITLITSVANINNGVSPFQPPIPVVMPEKSRISSTAVGAANNNSVGAIAQIMLVKN